MKAQRGDDILRINIEQRNSLLNFLRSWFNLDFRDYSVESLHRRFEKVMNEYRAGHVDDLISSLKDRPDARDYFLDSFTVNVTDYFRDPNSYACIKEKVFPILALKPKFKIWVAGCSTGEEVLSLCILLHEQGLLDRSRILATDISGSAVSKARHGDFCTDYSAVHEQQYQLAGGQHSFSEYFEDSERGTNLATALMRNVEWQSHDLINDHIPGKFDLIFCRNVFIYFKPILQYKVLHSLGDHLLPNGFLVQGSQESITLYNENQRFRELNPNCSIYQKNTQHSDTRR